VILIGGIDLSSEPIALVGTVTTFAMIHGLAGGGGRSRRISRSHPDSVSSTELRFRAAARPPSSRPWPR